jgi:hypothetical protein
MAKKKLISLEAHMLAARQAWWPNCPKGPNGIACPNCGAELRDQGRPTEYMAGAPRGVYMACQGCDYKGSRYLLPDEAPKA